MQEIFLQLREILQQKNTFVITTHINPDGDALGSEIALAVFLKNLGKEVTIYNQSETPKNFEWLASTFPIIQFSPQEHGKNILEAECCIVVDTNSPKRFSALQEYIIQSSGYKICIDHHLEQEPFADLYIIDTDVPATCELLYRIFSWWNFESITTPIAEALYTGIMTDTGSFRFPKTDDETHLIVADLLKRGVQPEKIYQTLFEEGQINKLHLVGSALSSLQVAHNGKVVYITITKKMLEETQTTESDTDNIVYNTMTIAGVKIGILFLENVDGIKISFRSKGEIFVNKLAKEFGGNGHKNAAGARVENITMKEIIPLVLERTQQFL